MPVDYSIFKRMISTVALSPQLGKYALPDEDDQKLLAAYEIMLPYLNEKQERLFDRAFVGIPDDCEQKLVFDIHMLIWWLLFIWQERVMLGETAFSYNEDYIDKYCCKKVREAFLCRGIKTQDLMKVFGLFGLIPGDIISVYVDGIGHMSIEATEDPINRISPAIGPPYPGPDIED